MNNKNIVLAFNDVSLSYPMRVGPPFVVFENISFSIPHGLKVGFWGPSGSGKSSLFYLASGLLKPTKGIIEKNEQIGLIHQQAYLNPWLTCKELIEMEIERGNYIYSVDELLAAIDMKKHEDHLFLHLSGGQKQRIALACTLASGSKLILADEPFGRIDSKTAETERIFINTLIEDQQLTFLLASHYSQHFKDFDGVFKLTNRSLEY
jgi:NitT/TauT family transport system ATP-binding protein